MVGLSDAQSNGKHPQPGRVALPVPSESAWDERIEDRRKWIGDWKAKKAESNGASAPTQR